MKPKLLDIQIVTGDARPIFRQIVDGIRMQIATGQVQPGDLLPSYRGLAMQLMVNANTVAKAYSQLASQGLVESRKGLGLFVAEPRRILSQDEEEQRLTRAVERFVNETIDLEYTDEELVQRLEAALDELKEKRKVQKS